MKDQILIIIPARAGSKGVPGKNYKILHNKPLFLHTVDVARKLKIKSRLVISTDCKNVISLAKEFSVNICERPKSLSYDHSLVIDAIKYTVLEEEKSRSDQFDYVVLLEPTSPLRTVKLVDECIFELINNESITSVATYCETDIPPTRSWAINGGEVSPFVPGSNPWLPRQEHDKAYQLNGLFYGIDRNVLMKDTTKSIVSKNHSAVISDREISIDIDTVDDFEYVNYLMMRKHEEK